MGTVEQIEVARRLVDHTVGRTPEIVGGQIQWSRLHGPESSHNGHSGARAPERGARRVDLHTLDTPLCSEGDPA